MKDTTTGYGEWDALEPGRGHYRGPRIAGNNSRLRVLLAAAAVLLVCGLALEEKVVNRVLGREQAVISTNDEHNLEEVRYMLALDRVRRALPVDRQR